MSKELLVPPAAAQDRPPLAYRVPPSSYFLVSAGFHYLGPSLAVLLFAHVDPLGVAWLRIASAGAVFALWRRPWRRWAAADSGQRRVHLAFGAVLALMNSLFYLAVDRLPLSTVGAVEFLGTVVLAAIGVRSRRNVAALVVAVAGVVVLTDIRLAAEPWGFAFAFGNSLGFMGYVVLGHRIANSAPARATTGETTGRFSWAGIDQLGLSMIIAAVVATPFGLAPALPAFAHPWWLAWGIGVGLCSSVIPYVTDQLAMARLRRGTFALMLALLPAAATVIGLVVLGQVPTGRDLLGVTLVVAGIALHQQRRGPAAA